jgi:hypothetical protein
MNALQRTLSIIFLGVTCLWSGTSMAAGAIASCYDAKLIAPATSAAVELFVVVDQTTLLDDTLRQAVANQMRPFLTPGNGFSVLVFSAYTQGKYTQLLTTGQLDHPLAPAIRDDTSKPVLTKFDQCMARQPALAAQAAGTALRNALDGTSDEIAKSDVLASLKDISAKVKQSKATEKVVLLVSDMLENSTISSFYASQAVRKIDPAHELQLVEKNHLFGDFGGARLYIMGAGLLNQVGKKNTNQYRDPKTMQALASFWKSYFDHSKGLLMEFGQPALLNQIK